MTNTTATKLETGDHVYLIRSVPTYPAIRSLDTGRIVQTTMDPDSPAHARYSVDFDDGAKGFFYASELRLNPEIDRAEFNAWISGMLD